MTLKEKQYAQQEVIEQLEENEGLQKQLILELEEKEQIKDKINRELEEKVRERTQELHKKNDELNVLTDQLNVLNSQLDKSLWQTKKEVDVLEKRQILSSKLSYDQFLLIYPSENDCLKFIHEIKWKEGFVCKKCGNEKWHSGGLPYSKKCSKCNTRESVTANTIFHRCRFSIQKALYIAYTVVDNDGVTLNELSEVLELRKSTCSSFRNKVKEKLSELKPKDKTLEKLIS